MTPEELGKLADELEARGKKARADLYARVGRQWAYFGFGFVCGGATAVFLKVLF
jgi:hypothetical protein